MRLFDMDLDFLTLHRHLLNKMPLPDLILE